MIKSSKNKGLTTTNIILICGFSAVIIAGGIIGYAILNKEEPAPAIVEETAGNFVIDENNIDNIDEILADKVKKGTFQTYMNAMWTFPDGTSPSSDAVVGNAASNNYPFYITVTLEGTGEEVYKSNLVPLGARIKEIKLTKDLEPGQYPAVCSYHFVDENGNATEGDVGIAVDLVVVG